MQDTHDRIEDINESFRGAWERNGGREQTKFFMDLILNNIEPGIMAEMQRDADSIVDIGCALGDGCQRLDEFFPDTFITGIDASSVAIEKARSLYSRIVFSIRPLEGKDADESNWQIVFCSNVLEHFSDPLPYFKELISMACWWVVILVPYNEANRIPGHRVTITESTFPEEYNGFKRIQTKVIDTGNNPYWAGPQILFVYEGDQTK
jgi:trans-aconitate methyltransferase